MPTMPQNNQHALTSHQAPAATNANPVVHSPEHLKKLMDAIGKQRAEKLIAGSMW